MEKIVIGPASVPRLASHARLQFDAGRERWVLLAPERVIFPDEVALDILKRCTGAVSVAAIVAELAAAFEAPSGEIEADVTGFLQDLADKGMIRA